MQTDATPLFRKHTRAPVDLYVNKIVGDEPHLVRVRDISVGGVFLYKLLEPDRLEAKTVGIEMKLPNCDDVIWAVGEIVRDNDGAHAIRFVRIAESDRKVIEEFVGAKEGEKSTRAA